MKWVGFTFAMCVTASVLYLLSRLSPEATTLLIGALVVAISGAIVGVPIVALAYLIARRERAPSGGGVARQADPMIEMMQRDYQEKRYALLMRKLEQQEQRMLPAPGNEYPAQSPSRQPAARDYIVLGGDNDIS